ncbi:MAG: hypothetical protein ACQETL_15745 [Bacteroidota bacterium]
MKKTLIFLFVCLIGFNNTSFGQEKFAEAYIITNQKDTIQGQILNKPDSDLAFEISFKAKGSDSEVESFNISDLVGFRFSNGRTFERINFNKTKLDTTAVFAKKVLTGKFDLWIWRNSNKEPDIFIKNNSNQKITQLSKAEDKHILKDGRKYIQHDHNFIYLIKQITDNEFPLSSRKKDLKYSEKNIINQISLINQKYEEQSPSEKYIEEIKFKYDIFIGIPLQLDPKSTEFRFGFFRRKVRVEKSTNFSTISGITYYGWHEHGGYDGSIENGISNYKWQLFNILPLGFHYQGKHKAIKPYTYAGIGLAILARSNYKIVNYQNHGSKTDFIPFPTLYVAAGLKIKTGSNFLFAEITPSIYQSTISLGFEF